MTKEKVFRLQPYNAPIRIVMNDDLNKAAQKFQATIHEHADGASLDCTFKYVMLFKSKTTMQVIVHECGHTIGWLMRDFGVKFDAENSEPFCYLMNHLFDETLAALRKMGAKIKDK